MRRVHCFSSANCRVFSFFPVEKWMVVVIIASRHRAHNGHHDIQKHYFKHSISLGSWTNDNNGIMCTMCWVECGWSSLRTSNKTTMISCSIGGRFSPKWIFLMLFLGSTRFNAMCQWALSPVDPQSSSLLSILREMANDLWYFSTV